MITKSLETLENIYEFSHENIVASLFEYPRFVIRLMHHPISTADTLVEISSGRWGKAHEAIFFLLVLLRAIVVQARSGTASSLLTVILLTSLRRHAAWFMHIALVGTIVWNYAVVQEWLVSLISSHRTILGLRIVNKRGINGFGYWLPTSITSVH